MATNTCQNCYRKNAAGASFCTNCGTPMAVTKPVAVSHHSGFGKQVILTLAVVVGAIGFWEFAKVAPGVIDDALKSRYAPTETRNDGEGISSIEPTKYGDKELYSAMRGREVALNRETPLMVNTMLKLTRVRYQHSEPTMTYNFEVKGEYFHEVSPEVITRGLERRYCVDGEFAEMRMNGVAAQFIYWDLGTKVYEHTAMNCD